MQTQPLATEQWMSQAATLLARTVQSAAVVTPPVAETSRFKHLELISIQGRLVLMVLVLQQGSVHQQMLTLAESVPQAGLSEAAARINTLCLDLNANDLRIRSVQLPMLEREIAELAADVIDRADSSQVRLVYREGLSDVIGTFPRTEGAQQIIRVVEERALLNTILAELLSPFVNDVQVLIAGNGALGRTESTVAGIQPLRHRRSVHRRSRRRGPDQYELPPRRQRRELRVERDVVDAGGRL